MELRGVGIGFRPALAAALLRNPERVDFVEVVAETCRDRRARREIVALAEIWPVVPHGVKLSLGSVEGIDEGRARSLGKLARDVRAPFVSEHVAFVRAGGKEIGHLTELSMSRASVKAVARNVDALRRHLPDVPLLLENVARGFLWDASEHEMSEGDFYHEVVRATGCELLLDVANLYANARNAGRDPFALLAEHPIAHVRLVHVAGGIVDDGFYYDTHAHPVPEVVFDLVARVLAVRPDVAVVLERDATFENTEAILAEVDRLRRQRPAQRLSARSEEHEAQSTPPSFGERAPSRPRAGEHASAVDTNGSSGALCEAQRMWAARLTNTLLDAHASPAFVRARGVLAKKRAEEALPLLRSLAPRLSLAEALLLGGLREAPRAGSMSAVVDAMRIVAASRTVPELAHAALRDELSLRARFVTVPSGSRSRLLPWVGRDVLIDGKTVWAWKGFGRSSTVRFRAQGD